VRYWPRASTVGARFWPIPRLVVGFENSTVGWAERSEARAVLRSNYTWARRCAPLPTLRTCCSVGGGNLRGSARATVALNTSALAQRNQLILHMRIASIDGLAKAPASLGGRIAHGAIRPRLARLSPPGWFAGNRAGLLFGRDEPPLFQTQDPGGLTASGRQGHAIEKAGRPLPKPQHICRNTLLLDPGVAQRTFLGRR
jgi:hypothetical protein